VSGYFLLPAFLVLFSVSSMAANPPSIDQRLQRLERLLDNQNLIEMFTTIQALKSEVSTLRGEIDLLNHEIDRLKKQQKDIYLDLDQRILQVGQNVSNLRSSTIAPAPGMLPGGDIGADAESEATSDEATTSVEDEQNVFSEQKDYEAALGVLKSGQYEDAIQSFQIFLISHPESVYAANAQYWMAEAFYVLKEYKSAITHFQKVISAYPDSRKVPDAHLKIGFSFYELKEWSSAVKALEQVISGFSTSTAARLAERRLEKMKLEGHI